MPNNILPPNLASPLRSGAWYKHKQTTRGDVMWIKTEGPHSAWADATKFETLYISYKGNGHYAIVATIGPRDLLISTHPTAKDATAVLDDLVQQFGQL